MEKQIENFEYLLEERKILQTKMSCRYNVTLSQALLTCSGGCQ